MGKKHLLVAVALTAMMLGTSSVKAADLETVVKPAGWYVSLFGGVSFLETVETTYFQVNYSGYEANVETDAGFIIGGAIGTHLTQDLRVEVEVAYSENDVDKIDYYDAGSSDNTVYDGHGKFGILTFMANLWYDVPLSQELTPYLGGGAGVAIVNGDVGYPELPGYDPIFDNSEVAFAFQLGAGFRWQVSDSMTLDVGYRLRGIDGPKFDTEVTIPQANAGDYKSDWIYTHNVIAGVSFGF